MLSSVTSSLAAAFAAVDAVDVVSHDLAFLTSPSAAAAVLGRATGAAGSGAPSSSSTSTSSILLAEERGDEAGDGAAPLVVPQGPRPVLSVGCDNIAWMHVVHTRLIQLGYNPGGWVLPWLPAAA
jgi:hypothetical protein